MSDGGACASAAEPVAGSVGESVGGAAFPLAPRHATIGNRHVGEHLHHVRTLIRWAGENPEREGLLDTPARVAKAYQELFAGYNADIDEVFYARDRNTLFFVFLRVSSRFPILYETRRRYSQLSKPLRRSDYR